MATSQVGHVAEGLKDDAICRGKWRGPGDQNCGFSTLGD